MARKEQRVEQPARGRTDKPAYRTIVMGTNQWIDPGMTGGELATELLKIVGLPEAWPGVLPGCTYRSRSAGCLEVPSAAIRNREEALRWKSAPGAALEASRQDASRVPQESDEPDPEPPVRQLSLFEEITQIEAGGEVWHS